MFSDIRRSAPRSGHGVRGRSRVHRARRRLRHLLADVPRARAGLGLSATGVRVLPAGRDRGPCDGGPCGGSGPCGGGGGGP